MPSSIDARLSTALTQFTSDTDDTPGVVDANEARELLSHAKEINAENAWLCGLIPSKKGTKQLEQLYKDNGAKFNPLAKVFADEFVSHGRSVDSRLADSYTSAVSATDNTPGVVDRSEALQLIGHAQAMNKEGNWFFGLFKGTRGTEELETMAGRLGGAFDPKAKAMVDTFVKTGRTTGLVIEWQTAKPLWHCHWFPMRESKAGGGDTTNNLFAPNGALDKYDQAFGTKSRDYELANNFRAHDSDSSDAGWAGHCNNASEVACMLDEPKRSVTYKGVTFSPRDIAGLLVKVSRSLATRVDFEGRRYNGESDDVGDPAPHDFLEKVLKAWGGGESPIPFVLDIDRKEQVWNYPYDQGKVTESSKAPAGFDTSSLPEGGYISFYKAEMKGTTFDAQARNYEFWIQYSDDGSVLKSDWIEGGDRKVNPDFAWRPHPRGDLSKKENWVSSAHKQNNPHVRAEDVFEIYSRSIA